MSDTNDPTSPEATKGKMTSDEVTAEHSQGPAARFVPLTFYDEEREILTAPPRDDEIAIRPDNGALYIPEMHLRKRLNEAFAPGIWTLWQNAPSAYRPDLGEVVYDATLIIRHSAVARATGSQRWQTGRNWGMDYGGATESARSSCLRRCMKDLGAYSEMWDKVWCEAWKQKHAHRIEVANQKTGEIDWEWHRKDRPAPWNTAKKGERQGRSQPPSRKASEPPASGSQPRAAVPHDQGSGDGGRPKIRDPEAPVTEKQAHALERMCEKIAPSAVEAQLRERGAGSIMELTKGEASVMIAWAQGELAGGGG